MKPLHFKISAITLFSFFVTSAFSQVNWTINGNGNITGGTNFLGTTNNQSVDFRTNNTIRMTILGPAGPTQGFVGIGLVAPAFQLDVKNRIDVDVPFPAAPPLGLGYFIGGFDVLQVP